MTIDPAKALVPGSAGEFYWGYASGTVVAPAARANASYASSNTGNVNPYSAACFFTTSPATAGSE